MDEMNLGKPGEEARKAWKRREQALLADGGVTLQRLFKPVGFLPSSRPSLARYSLRREARALSSLLSSLLLSLPPCHVGHWYPQAPPRRTHANVTHLPICPSHRPNATARLSQRLSLIPSPSYSSTRNPLLLTPSDSHIPPNA